MSEDGIVRLGLLGTGAIAQVIHLPVLTQMRGVEVRTVCDADQPKAASLAARFGVPNALRRDEAVFEDPELDGILICTPSHLHESQAIAALEAGKDVLVEKPLALTPEGARRVVVAAERSGRSVVVAMNNRHRPDALALKPFARGGELGDLFFVKAGWLNRKVRLVRPTWRHRLATSGGGALMDVGVQILDLCLWVLDYPRVDRVVAHMHPGEGMEVEDSAAVLFTLKEGPAVSVEVTWSLLGQRDRHYLQVFGTHGSGSLSPLAVFKELEQGLVDVTPQLPIGQGNAYTASYRAQLQEFVEIAAGDKRATPPEDQVALMRLIQLAYESAREGREVQA